MKTAILSLAVLITLMLGSVAAPRQASAAVAAGCDPGSAFLLFPPWYKYLDIGPKGNDKCAITLPADKDGNTDWGLTGGRIGLAVVEILLRLGGLIAVVFVLYGGIRLILSEGESDNFKKAKDTIFNAIIGLLIVLVATAAVNFVGSTLIK